ncbi:MAG: stage II sporulation protein M [Rhodoglobus sp.]
MDLNAYTAAHREEWDRLAQLGKQHRFSGSEADELIDLYQSGATQLSTIKTTAGQSVPGDRLSLWLSRARLRFTGASANVMSQLPRFFAAQLPAALYRIRWLCLATTAASVLIAFLYAWWATENPQVLAAMGSTAELKKYATEDFVNYYSENSGTSFTSFVWTNNAWLAAQCVAFGIVGVYAPYLLFTNAQSIGMTGALMNQFDRLDVFFLYIAPHGQLELYSIFVAGAAGMHIFWAWIAPGARTRAQALSEEGRALFTVVVGLILALLVSGLIEGFVTRQEWPWPIKIGIGTIALGGFLFYQLLVGGRAARAGETGDLEEFEAGTKQLVAG